MKKWTSRILLLIIGAVITGGMGYFIKSLEVKESHKKKWLDLFTSVNHQNIDEDELKKNNFKMSYNDKPVNSLGGIDVKLYNYNDINYDNIPIYIEITPEKGDTLQIVDPEAMGTNNSTETIKILGDSVHFSISKPIIFEYLIEDASYADSLGKTIFSANFGIICKKKPSARAYIKKPGLDTREYRQEHFNRDPWWQSDLMLIVYGIIGLITYIFIIVKLVSFSTFKRERKIGPYLKEELQKVIDNKQLILDAENIIKEYGKIVKQFDTEKDVSLFKQWLKHKENK